jgi:signal transduction histidine kinase/ActR/RegA family two-component response regulator
MTARLVRVLGGLRARVAVLLLAGQLLAACGFYVLFASMTRDWARDGLTHEGREVAERIARDAVTPVVLGDDRGLQEMLTRQTRDPDVVGAEILAPGGRSVVARVIDERLWTPGMATVPRQRRGTEVTRHRVGGVDVVDVVAPIVRPNGTLRPLGNDDDLFGLPAPPARAARRAELIGWVRMEFSTARVEAELAGARQLGAIVLVLAVALGLMASLALLRIVVRPLREASGLAREIAGGHLERRMPVRGTDELGGLAESMNTMAAALSESIARERAEAAALRETADAVVAIAQGARATSDPESVFRVVAAQLRIVTGCDGVALALPATDGTGLRFQHLDPPGPWGGLEVGDAFDGPLAVALSGSAATSLRLETADHGYPLSTLLAARGMGAMLLVPLTLESGPPAALLLVAHDASAFGRSQGRIVSGLASHLGAALHAAQLRERLQRAIEELRVTQEQLVRSERLRVAGELASGIAHEFNNVLAAILGRVQLLRRRAGQGTLAPDELGDALGILEVAAHDGAETVRRLRQFSGGSGTEPAGTVDLDAVIREAVEFTRPRWKHEVAGGREPIDLTVDSSPGIWVRGHATQLREVFTNLVLNAIDALPGGGHIRLSAAIDGATARAAVEDDGIGMSAETQRRAFEPFFTTKGVGGTGLGLSVVYGIVQRHGGTLEASSTPGAGTRIAVSFPTAEPIEAAPPPEPMRVVGDDTRALSVMVVDDEPAVRELIRDILAVLGHRVTAHEGAEEALRAFRPGGCDLVLTDLGMPGMNGWQLSQRLREADPNVAIVFVTGWGEELSADQVRRAGADDVIGKPFGIEDIERVTRRVDDRRAA